MLTGDIFYYDGALNLRKGFDSDALPDEAFEASRRFPHDYVRWNCVTGDRRDIRWFRNGERVEDPRSGS